MITSFKRSAAAAAVVLLVGALAGCGGDDDAGAAGTGTATPAWESTSGSAPATDPAESDESAATDAPVEDEQPDGEQPAPAGDEAAGESPPDTSDASGGDASGGGGDTSGDTSGGGDASGGGPGGAAPQPPPPNPNPGAGPVEACTLGADAIAGVLGTGVTSEDLSLAEGFRPSCGWTGSGGQEVIVSVSGYDDWISMDALLGGGAEAVDDLGTESWASLSSPSNVQVAWRRDTISVAVAASLASGGQEVLDIAHAVDAALRQAGY